MAAMTVRDIDDELKSKLRIRAAENNRSMEAEVRAILAEVLDQPQRSQDLGRGILEIFSSVGGVELELPSRKSRPRAMEFDD